MAQLCKKALELGANAILGFRSGLDVEGDSGIVQRCYGTAVRVERIRAEEGGRGAGVGKQAEGHGNEQRRERRGSDADQDGRDTAFTAMVAARQARARHREGEDSEVQLLTLRDFGPQVRIRVGGMVVARR